MPPVLTGLTAVAAFGSLGIPGLSGFVAEFQIFTGVIGAGAVISGALGIVGILITAALFLRVLQRAFLGRPGELTSQVTDVRPRELAAIAPLLILSLIIGIAPRWLLDLIEPASAALVNLVSR